MPTPQTAIFEDDHRHHYALEYNINSTASLDDVRACLCKAITDARQCCRLTVAIGPSLWDQFSPAEKPIGFAPLKAITGHDGYSLPASNADILFWLQGDGVDCVFDGVQVIQQNLKLIAALGLAQPGFTYKDSRDLIGFVDGSANPVGDDIKQAALVPKGEPFAGGAHVFSQKWIHDLDGFNKLSVKAQEAIIGRTKEDSIELADDVMPATSHVSRTDVKVDGVSQTIWRTSFPFGDAHDCGLYFLCFSCTPSRVQVQLERMFGVSGDGLHDHLIHYSKPVTGAYWFAPAEQDLWQLLEG